VPDPIDTGIYLATYYRVGSFRVILYMYTNNRQNTSFYITTHGNVLPTPYFMIPIYITLRHTLRNTYPPSPGKNREKQNADVIYWATAQGPYKYDDFPPN